MLLLCGILHVFQEGAAFQAIVFWAERPCSFLQGCNVGIQDIELDGPGLLLVVGILG